MSVAVFVSCEKEDGIIDSAETNTNSTTPDDAKPQKPYAYVCSAKAKKIWSYKQQINVGQSVTKVCQDYVTVYIYKLDGIEYGSIDKSATSKKYDLDFDYSSKYLGVAVNGYNAYFKGTGDARYYIDRRYYN